MSPWRKLFGQQKSEDRLSQWRRVIDNVAERQAVKFRVKVSDYYPDEWLNAVALCAADTQDRIAAIDCIEMAFLKMNALCHHRQDDELVWQRELCEVDG